MRRMGLGGFLAMWLTSTVALAGGFEFPDWGAHAVGRSGAFTAKVDDLSAMAINPGGLANLKGVNLYYSHNITRLALDYTRADASIYAANPKYPNDPTKDTVTKVPFQTVSNDAPWFPLGAMLAASYDFGLDLFTFGVGVWGPSAVGHTKFGLVPEVASLAPGADGTVAKQPNGAKYTMVERDILILYYTLSAGFRLPNHRFGVGIDLQWVDMPKLQFDMMVDGTETSKVYPVASSWDTLARVDATDHTNVSTIIGFWARPWDFLELGLSSRPLPVWFNGKGTVNVDLFGSAFQNPDGTYWAADEWGLSDDGTGTGDNTTKATVKFTMPPWIRFGARYFYGTPGDEVFDVELDFVYEFWRTFDKIGVDMNTQMNVEKNLGKIVALGPISIDKKFKDTWSLRLGGDWQVWHERLWLRAGGFYETAASPYAYSSVDFEAFERAGGSLGLSWQFYPRMFLNVAFLHIQQFTRTVSEEDSRIVQQRPGSRCTQSDDKSICDPHYATWGGTAAVGAGTYSSMVDTISFGVSAGF